MILAPTRHFVELNIFCYSNEMFYWDTNKIWLDTFFSQYVRNLNLCITYQATDVQTSYISPIH